MPIIRVPDGRLVRFPDDMPTSEIKSIISKKFPDAYKTGPQQTDGIQLSDEQKAKIKATNEAYYQKQEQNGAFVNNPMIRGSVALMQGIANSSFNPFGHIYRAAGGNMKVLEPQNAAERALEKVGEYGYDALASVPAGAGLKAAGVLGQGVSKTSKALRAILAPGVDAIKVAAAGGALEGAVNPDSVAGKIAANVIGGSVAGSLGNMGKRTYKTLKGGLENIARDKDALRIVRRAAKFDDDVAGAVTREASGVAEDINEASKNALAEVLDGVSNQERYKSVRKAYNNFLDRNKGKKIKGFDKLSELNPFQTKKYDRALGEGLEKAKYGTQAGEITHLLGARGVIDDMINKSYIQEFPGKKATLDTSNLVELRKKLDKLLFQNPEVKGADRSFELYHQFDDMYQKGLKYQPGSAKNVLDDIALAAGGDAEKSLMARIGLKKGLYDKLAEKAVPSKNFSKEAKDYQNIIKKINYKEDYNNLMKELSKNETAYNRLAKLTNTAENRLSAPEASKIFAREQVESKGAFVGAMIDSILGKLNSGYYKNAAKQLLENGGEEVSILTKPALEQVIGNILIGGVKGPARNTQLLMNKAIADELLKGE